MKFLFLIFLFPSVTFCQSINWEWARQGSGGGYEEGIATAVDANGNVCIAGMFQADSARFGNTVLYSPAYYQTFVARYSRSGDLLWAKNAISSNDGFSFNMGMVIDSSNNIYTGGIFTGTSITFDTDTLFNLTPSGIEFNSFLFKLDSSGNALWAKSSAKADEVQGENLTVDNSGNVFTVASVKGDSIVFDSATFQIASGLGVYINKYNSQGKFLWAKIINGPFGNFGSYMNAVSTDASGSVYIAGVFQTDSATFDNTTLYNSNPQHYFANGYIAKYDSSGNLQWAKQIVGNVASGAPLFITTDKSGYTYIAGSFTSDTLNFGDISLYNVNQAGYYNSIYNFFLVKYDALGNVIWAKSEGIYDKPVYVDGLTTDGNNNIYVPGYFRGDSISFDSITLYRPAIYNYADQMFMVVLDSSGKALYGTALGGGGDDQVGISINAAGDMYMGGDFWVNPFILGCDTLIETVPDPLNHGSGSENIFIAKFNINQYASVDSLNYQISSSNICSGGSAIISFSGVSSVSILPSGSVTWADTLHAILKPDTTTMFSLSAISRCGAYQTKVFTLNVIKDTVHISSSEPTICPTDSAQICAPPNFVSYTWNNNNGTGKCIQAKSAGNYYVTVTDNSGCTAESNHISITAFEAPAVSISQSGDTLRVYNETNVQWYLNDNPIPNATQNIYIAQAFGNYKVSVTDSNGCTSFSLPTRITGIQNIINNENISIYPNPLSAGNFQLAVSNNLIGAQVEILDDNVRVVYKSEIKNLHSEINTQFSGGVYLLRITTGTGVVVRKLVKL